MNIIYGNVWLLIHGSAQSCTRVSAQPTPEYLHVSTVYKKKTSEMMNENSTVYSVYQCIQLLLIKPAATSSPDLLGELPYWYYWYCWYPERQTNLQNTTSRIGNGDIWILVIAETKTKQCSYQ